ncbi:MAG: acyl-CoA dehydratase activase [Synergistaceae bacterium]|jgi:predicted CoA-substrate-specific enzyme activase|nr:acyl-CoA dehydratase activase [Synergistaceae bacterium]
MKLQNFFAPEKVSKIPDCCVIGLDIGSRQSKAVLLTEGEIYTSLTPTGFSMKNTAKELLKDLSLQSGVEAETVDYIVATGYGRVSIDFDFAPCRTVTEISCHGLGGSFLGENIHTIIDIGGQDSKVIRIDPNDGRVLDFVMNDKCAAGTGRFLEKTANILGREVAELGELSLSAVKAADISSQCVVFAESEIISGRAMGENVNNLAAGIHASVVKRLSNLLSRTGVESGVLFSGGVSKNVGMRKALEELLGFPVVTSPLDAVYTGALGAVLFAGLYALQRSERRQAAASRFSLDLTDLDNAVSNRQERYIQKTTGKKQNVAYLCTYTPVEILNAANVAHMRLLHAGNQKELSAGETITQSIFCDFTKSCLGGFSENYPLYASVDKVYTFYTCDCMRKTAEAIGGQFVPTSIFNLPRLIGNQSSLDYYVTELRGFTADLEKITREKISPEKIRENVVLYNRVRALMRQISGFRKMTPPPLKSMDFQKIALACYYLPPQELLPHLEGIAARLKEYEPPADGRGTIRLMLAGGIVADGDGKLTALIERDLGASIVVEDNCTGYSPFAKDVPETGGDVFEDIAAGYLGQAPCARMKPLSERVEFSARLALEYDVDGVVFYYMKFCPCYGMAKNEFIRRFQEIGIPLLELPGDYSAGDEGQIKTRLEAFVEVLEKREINFV